MNAYPDTVISVYDTDPSIVKHDRTNIKGNKSTSRKSRSHPSKKNEKLTVGRGAILVDSDRAELQRELLKVKWQNLSVNLL